jgi:hypothetical protein
VDDDNGDRTVLIAVATERALSTANGAPAGGSLSPAGRRVYSSARLAGEARVPPRQHSTACRRADFGRPAIVGGLARGRGPVITLAAARSLPARASDE